tara:strand:+ start:91594 stop:92454 length:861 start_codon:yes stop_codon:yes gene_type:complete
MSEHNTPNHDEQKLDQIIDLALGQQDTNDHNLSDDSLQSEFEQAAALLDVAAAKSNPIEMPSGFADRIKAKVPEYPNQASTSFENKNERDQSPIPFPSSNQTSNGSRLFQWTPWIVAAASVMIAAVSIFMLRPTQTQVPLDLNTDRLALINDTPPDQLIQWDWISTDDEAVVGEVIGDVVWSDALNKGYMRISGLAVNDPSLKQYQLWIFDATNPTGDLPQFGEGLLSQRPIDGGVFNIDTNGEIIIEINAKLLVEQAAAFAITVEPPGGVVVSDRSRVPLLALAP